MVEMPVLAQGLHDRTRPPKQEVKPDELRFHIEGVHGVALGVKHNVFTIKSLGEQAWFGGERHFLGPFILHFLFYLIHQINIS